MDKTVFLRGEGSDVGSMTIGIALFVLIIIAGLVIGLRLSSTSPQRRAVAVAFILMALVAGLFWGVAMGASQVWTAPFFAIACIVVPVAAYTGIMKASKGARPEPKRRDDARARASKPSAALEGAVMPVTPNHPVNEFRDLHAAPEEEVAEEEAAEEAVEAEAVEPEDEKAPAQEEPAETAEPAADKDGETAGPAESAASEKTDEQEEEVPQRAEAFIEEYLVDENEGEDGMFEPEAAPVLHPRKAENHTTSTMVLTVPFAEGDEQYLVVSDTTSVPNPIMAYKRSTSSHLVPIGSPRRGVHAKPVESSQEKAAGQVVVPTFASPSEQPVAKPMPQVEEPVELEEPALGEPPASVDFAALFRREQPASADESVAPQLELDFSPRPESPFKPAFQPFAKHAPAAPAPNITPAPAAGEKETPAAQPAAERVAAKAEPEKPRFVESDLCMPSRARRAPEPEEPQVDEAPAPRVEERRARSRRADERRIEELRAMRERTKPTSRRAIREEAAEAAVDRPSSHVERRAAADPAAAFTPRTEPERSVEGKSEPLAAPAPAPQPEPAAVAAPQSEPAFAVAAAPTPAAQSSSEPVVAPEPVATPAMPVSAPAPQPESIEAAPVPIVAPAPQPEAAPAPALQPEPAPVASVPAPVAAEPAPAVPAPASTREARYEEFIGKAQGLRDKGLFPVAARLYGEAAAAAATSADARRARFEEMACYVKAGQGDKARALAAELRRASVLTRVERIKLDAVERMG